MYNNTKSLMSFVFKLLSTMFIISSSIFAADSYLEPINIPAYNENDTTHVLITESNGNWSSSVLNNPAYKHFYIAPGNYTSSITLTADGTSTNRRTINLYNDNDIHPASLPTSEQANVKLVWNSASYWDIDRLSFLSYQAEVDIRWFDNSSNHNTLNRINLKNYYYGIIITGSSSYNSIQNSYIDHMTHAGRLSDNVGIALQSWGATSASPVYSFHNKIINNDIRNAGDGIQLVRKQGEQENSFYNGTIIDSNRIWNDGDVYTNGDYATNGYNPNGEYQIGENAMDFKQGSSDPENPVIVSNNIMWGYREGDGTAGGAQTTGPGSAFPIHFEVRNVLFDRNIIFDSMVGFGASGVFSGQSYAMADCTFTNNIMYNMGHINPENSNWITASNLYELNNVTYENNSIIDIAQNTESYWFRFENVSGATTFKNNLMIDANGWTSNSTDTAGVTVDENYYYNTPTVLPLSTNNNIKIPATETMDDYFFEYEVFTVSPKSKTLIGVISTIDSPHYGVAGSSITQDTTSVGYQSGKMWIIDPIILKQKE